MGYVPDATIAAMKGDYKLGIFFRLGTVPALHMVFSINDIPIAMPGLDLPGTIYNAGGRFRDIPQLELMLNGIASKVSFSLSGLDQSTVALMMDSAPEVLGALVTVGICPMDQYWQPVGNIVPVWTGTAEYVSEEMPVELDSTKPRIQNLTLVASTGDMSRAFPNLQTFTDQAQRVVSATDNFCSRVTRYVQTYLVSWPRF